MDFNNIKIGVKNSKLIFLNKKIIFNDEIFLLDDELATKFISENEGSVIDENYDIEFDELSYLILDEMNKRETLSFNDNTVEEFKKLYYEHLRKEDEKSEIEILKEQVNELRKIIEGGEFNE